MIGEYVENIFKFQILILLQFTLVRNSVLNELTRLGQKTVIRKVEYGAPNAEGWFKVTFFLVRSN